MNVLVACEESQEVCKAFRFLGYVAWSCDILECSGGHPEWHIQGDCLPLLDGNCVFKTADGKTHNQIGKWDLIIALPPCTYLTVAGNRCYSLRCTPAEKVVARMKKREEAIVFFLRLYFADCDHIAVENPKGRISSVFEPPTQYVDPYMFAESEEDYENYVSKRTGLWLKGLPPLITNQLSKPEPYAGYRILGTTGKLKANTWTERQKGQDRAKIRSKTFPGIARAMAEQWSKYITEEDHEQTF